MRIDAKRRRLIGTLGGMGALGVCRAAGVMGGWGGVALAPPSERVVKVVARRFVFEPEKIELVIGEPVRLELTTLDVMMGFSCYELGLRADLVPDRVATVRFTPEKAGLFEFSCDVFCGSGHEEMGGAINVKA